MARANLQGQEQEWESGPECPDGLHQHNPEPE